MEQKNGKTKKKLWQRRAAAIAAGALTAASLTVGALFGSADELLGGEETDETAMQQAAVLEREQRNAAAQGKSALAGRLRTFLLRRNAAVRALVLLPLWAAGRAALSLLSALFAALGPYWGTILGALANGLLLLALFLPAYKALYPDKSLKNLFQKGRWLWFLLGAIALGAADALFRHSLSDYRALSLFIKLFAGLLALICLCWRVLEPKIVSVPKERAV